DGGWAGLQDGGHTLERFAQRLEMDDTQRRHGRAIYERNRDLGRHGQRAFASAEQAGQVSVGWLEEVLEAVAAIAAPVPGGVPVDDPAAGLERLIPPAGDLPFPARRKGFLSPQLGGGRSEAGARAVIQKGRGLSA